jgi:hypothetical protein
MSIEDEDETGWLWTCDAAKFAPTAAPTSLEMDFWFSNVNTPQELAEAEVWTSCQNGETHGSD